jgi:3-oxoadipate enol-lactonase
MPEIQANGLAFHYQWQGREDGPAVVLINGLLTDLSSWNGHLPYYTDKFHLLTYDCRGQGGTDKPDNGPYPPRLHAEDLKALLDALNVPKVALVGVSSGACVALDFAARWPERVTALVSANGYAKADTVMQVKLTSWVNANAIGGGPLRFDVSSPWIWGATFLNNNFEALKPFREKGSTLPVYAVRNLIEGAKDHDVLEQLPNITCPTLLMTGDEDVLTPLSYSHAIQRRIAGSRLVMLENAGHCMFLERVSRFAEVASGFLAESLL